MSSTRSPQASSWWVMKPGKVYSQDEQRDWPRIRIYYAVKDHQKFTEDVNSGKVLTQSRDPWFREVPWWTDQSSGFKLLEEVVPVTSLPELETVRSAPPYHTPTWGAAALGWAGGTLVLALFVFLVRAAEKCLDKKLFKSMRRQSPEWPTPDVFATRHQHSDESDPGAAGRPADVNGFFTEPVCAVDLPPPYSDCASVLKDASDTKKYPMGCNDDYLPSYSDCYVPVYPKGKLSDVYIACREVAGAGRAEDTSNNTATGSATAADVTEHGHADLGVPDTVIVTETAETNNGRVKDDAETQNMGGTVNV